MVFIKNYFIYFKTQNKLSTSTFWTSFKFKITDRFNIQSKLATNSFNFKPTTYVKYTINNKSSTPNLLIKFLGLTPKIQWSTTQLIKNLKQYIFSYIFLILYNVKWILTPLLISALYFYFSLFFIQIDVTKQISVWFIVLVIFYILMSTFNNFLNKYKYGKFTSAIQRFWKRTGMTFWLIEGFLFILFFYYFLNSSQEPLYMFDYSSLNQELLIQLKTSYKSLILLSLAIYFTYVLLINNSYLTYYQNILLLSFISLIIIYTLYIESYQFVYVISYYTAKNWNFDTNNQIWILELEQNNIRVKQQYFILCLIAKYWHFIFIFISWVFFLIKCFEINKINYIMLGYNLQNLLILYILNLFCLIQWIKWLSKKFLELTYYWFHIQYDEKLLNTIINEVYLTLKSILTVNCDNLNLNIQSISTTLYYNNELSLWKYIKCLQKILIIPL